jgi:Proprotein convertase P-domain
MDSFKKLLAGTTLMIAFACTANAQFLSTPSSNVDASTGVFQTYFITDDFRGSGVVTRDPRLIYSCAHVFYENGRWSTDFYFSRAYNKATRPVAADGIGPRGIHYFTSYSPKADEQNNSDQTFAVDFSIVYGNSNFGTPKGYFRNGGAALTSGNVKQIVGYPAIIFTTGALGGYFQHTTGQFPNAGEQILGNFYEFEGVNSGPGNSGGPVFVQDTASGEELLAGILVSGYRDRIRCGVVAISPAVDVLASKALNSVSVSRSFSNFTKLPLPDKSKKFSKSSVEVSGFSGDVIDLKLSMSVDTKRRGDIDVFLKSPSGRTRWVSKRSGGDAANLKIKNMDLTKTFSGSTASGTWELKIRDAVAGNKATLNGYSLRMKAF